MHTGYIVEVKDLRPHNNADKLQLATFFGETVIVGLDTKIGDIGIYFPCDLQLSEEYCDVNDLCRKRADGTDGKGYLERDKRNIKAISLRGEKSYGLYAPLTSLEPFGDITQLRVGDTIDVFNGHEICKKYIPRSNIRGEHYSKGNKTRKHKIPVAPLFMEHADTEQLAYNLDAFHCGDEVEITLKMHGTSQRTGYLPIFKGYKDSLPRKIINKIYTSLKVDKNWGTNDRKAFYNSLKHGEPIYDWGYVSGTRRTILENFEGGFYGSNVFREQHSKFFEGKLWKGETVYYEVVSFTDDGTPIMGKGKVPKEAQSQYGTEMVFHYGRSEGSDFYVYRMSMTNEDGDVVEYTPDFMRYRCEQMGAKTVPVLWRGTIPYTMDDIESPIPGHRIVLKEGESAGEWIKKVAEQYYDGPDPIGKTHVREGVVVRILNRPKFCAYKHKNFLFKQISGIISETIADNNETISDDILSEM